MKHFEALMLVIDMTNNALLQCQDIHGDCLLFPKTRFCLHPMAKMAKVGFGPTLALYHSQRDPWRGHETFRGLSTCDRHNKQCTAFISSNSWGPFTLSENLTLSSFHCKNGKIRFWANFSPISQPKKQTRRGHETFIGLSTCDRHNKQRTASISSHSWGLFTLPENQTLSPFHVKNGRLSFGPTLAE